MVFQKPVVIDCRGHLLGRLASQIAKELLLGQHIVAVRCEEIEVSGSLIRNKMKYHRFLNKRTLTNPKKGPIHYRSPARMLWRTVRGMIPHKTARGAAAMQRLKVFEGVPTPFDKTKRMIVPEALRVTRLAPGRRYTNLGRLASEVGWKNKDLIARLEEKRKVKSEAYYQKKKAMNKLKAEAVKAADLSAVAPILEKHGF